MLRFLKRKYKKASSVLSQHNIHSWWCLQFSSGRPSLTIIWAITKAYIIVTQDTKVNSWKQKIFKILNCLRARLFPKNCVKIPTLGQKIWIKIPTLRPKHLIISCWIKNPYPGAWSCDKNPHPGATFPFQNPQAPPGQNIDRCINSS